MELSKRITQLATALQSDLQACIDADNKRTAGAWKHQGGEVISNQLSSPIVIATLHNHAAVYEALLDEVKWWTTEYEDAKALLNIRDIAAQRILTIARTCCKEPHGFDATRAALEHRMMNLVDDTPADAGHSNEGE